MMMVERRIIRRKAPVPLEPQMIREKEEMLGGTARSAGA